MRTRGRLSLAAVSTSPVEVVERLPAPAHLTDEQKREWVALVNTMPAAHFMRGNQGLLEQYCRHMVAARHLAQLIDQAESRDIKYPRTAKGRREANIAKRLLLNLYRQQKEESNIIQRLLTCMRLTQQSIYRGETVKHPKTGAATKPWDDD